MALAVEKTANLSLRKTLDKLVPEEDSEFTRSRQLLDVNTWQLKPPHFARPVSDGHGTLDIVACYKLNDYKLLGRA